MHLSVHLLIVWYTSSVSFTQVMAEEILANSESCVDSDSKCPQWASQGECQSNAVWMMANCRRSCYSCQGGDKAWKLRNYIASKYDNATNSNLSRIVSIESVRINHIDMDEEKQVVRIYGRMVLSWNDTKVAWDRNHWDLSWLNFYWIQIWTPQLVQINPTTVNPGTMVNKVLAANYTGQVYMWLDFSFTSPYHFQYEDYPNDYQHICFKFDDKRYFSVRFIVSSEVKSKQREELTETHTIGWTLENFEVNDSKYYAQVLSDWRRDPFDVQTSNCELCVGLRRNAVYFTTEMLFPAMITSMITLSSALFQLTTTQPVLIALSLLAQIISLTLINSRLPQFALHTPAILKYAGFNLVVSTFLFLLSIILRKLSQIDTSIPPPHSLDQFACFVNRVTLLPSSGKEDEDSARKKYAPLANALNNLTFLIFLAIYFLVFVCSFLL